MVYSVFNEDWANTDEGDIWDDFSTRRSEILDPLVVIPKVSRELLGCM
jgi:hypothetical protein